MTSFPAKWQGRKIGKTNKKLSNKLKFSQFLIDILAGRNISSEVEVMSFLNPTLKNLHDCMMLPGIEKGIKRIKEAIASNENILIFGDYDADGIISSVILYKFLRELGLNTEVYIPDRFNEGYDLNLDFFKKIFSQSKYNLMICVDCGTNSLEVQKFIRGKRELDVIICDHHIQSVDLDVRQENYIIINPRIKCSNYPFKHLSGAGVTLKFIIGILRGLEDARKKKFSRDYLTTLLDLVAISTIADLMPLVDENRIIVKKGLELLKRTINPGLKKMINAVVKDKECIDEYDIGYIIAPRLNAAGRIKNARSSFDLLTAGGKVLDELLNDLNSFNEERQNIQKKIFDEIIKSNDFDEIIKEKRIFIEKSKEWNEGVLGIVASDIVKKFNIPAILFRESEGKLKGSGRSTDKFDLYGNLLSCSGLFDNFGGHRTACGISMDILSFETFYNNMIEIALKKIEIRDIEKKSFYDLELDFKDINDELLKEIDLLKPYGISNPQPTFVTGDCEIVSFCYLSEEKHVKFKLRSAGTEVAAIMFKIDKNVKEKIKAGKKINILYKIEENIWGYRKEIQLVIQDLF
ncbi:MAG: single-stranded-DNA-specific exonuclease RecJ [Actinomycetota bacterium]|nr:single-stranded-DNA-specific exonuclease RecJ [Actinomycetota bacterium]